MDDDAGVQSPEAAPSHADGDGYCRLYACSATPMDWASAGPCREKARPRRGGRDCQNEQAPVCCPRQQLCPSSQPARGCLKAVPPSPSLHAALNLFWLGYQRHLVLPSIIARQRSQGSQQDMACHPTSSLGRPHTRGTAPAHASFPRPPGVRGPKPTSPAAWKNKSAACTP